MEGKLVTDGKKNYSLFVENELFASNMESVLDIHKLSLTNCQAIERGYDLDELAYHNSLSYTWLETNERDKELISKYGIEGFKAGFQKALEILGDKKFTEDDIRKAYNTNHYSQESKDSNWHNFIQSIQKTEWDVVIEMEGPLVYPANLPRLGEERPAYRPKLDNEGRLILKRKK